MSLLERHCEQISLSAQSIANLPFPPPKIFTNALLSNADITSLIRDTEPHERALFSVPPPPPSALSYPEPNASTNRRQTVFNVAQGEVTARLSGPGSRVPKRNRAVAAVLGPELHSEVRKTEGKGAGEIDIEVLLRGAEKLNDVYSVPGVPERVQSLRMRYAQISGSVGHYERKVERQTRELERMNRGESWDEEDEEDGDEESESYERFDEEQLEITDEDLRREEEEIAELERKKKELEQRVKGMEKDLGGLLR